jgi:hypothetical protein
MDTNLVVNVTAAAVVVVTNWVSIGTFSSRTGTQYDVLQGSVQTNVVGRMTAEGQTVEHIFKSSAGPTNDYLRLVPIATQTFPVNPPPLPINPRFIYDGQVVVPTKNP